MLTPEADTLKNAGIEVETIVRHGNIGETLADLAKECDVAQIFIGRRGESKMRSMLFGSVTASLIQVAPVPVTVIP